MEASQQFLPGTEAQTVQKGVFCGDCSVPMKEGVDLRRGKPPKYWRHCPQCQTRVYLKSKPKKIEKKPKSQPTLPGM